MKPRPALPSPQRGPIDWQEVHRRLAQAQAATEAALRLSPERARMVLEERAVLLARVPASAPAVGASLQVVVFSLGDERYALEARHVLEVVRLRDYVPLPGAPPFLFGALNLRGEVLAVMDLRKLFGVAERGPSEHSRVLVLGADRPEFGALADAVSEVLALRRADILEPPGTVAGVGREYLLGVTADALLVLNGEVLLQDSRLFVDQGEEARP